MCVSRLHVRRSLRRVLNIPGAFQANTSLNGGSSRREGQRGAEKCPDSRTTQFVKSRHFTSTGSSRVKVHDLLGVRAPSFCTTDQLASNQSVNLPVTRGMAAEEAEIDDEWEDARPEYHRVVKDLRFLNISIKTYEKKTGGGFPREEYFAFRIVSM